jgi:hypothetical protein
MLPLSLLVSGSTASAAGTLDATNYTVKCDTLTKGRVGFAPPLKLGGALPETTKVKGSLSGCVATPAPGGDHVTVLSGSISGLITGGTNDCLSLLGPSAATGTITIKWKTVPALINATTVVTLSAGTVSGGTANPFLPNTATYGKFTIFGASQTGAFGGPSGTGAASSTTALTTQDINVLGAQCAAITGMKAVNLGVTTVSLG